MQTDRKDQEAKDPGQGNEQNSRLILGIKVTLGELSFSSLKGEIQSEPEPIVISSTRQHSRLELFIVDSDATLWPKIKAAEGAQATVEVGYPPGPLELRLTGKAYRVGRRLDDAIVIEVVDDAYGANNSLGSGVVSTEAPTPSAPAQTTVVTPQATGRPTPASPASTSGQSQTAAQILAQSPLDRESKNKLNDIKTAKPEELVQIASQTATGGAVKISPSQQVAATTGLQFEARTTGADSSKGQVQSVNTPLKTAAKEAASRGEVIVSEENTLSVVGAGQGSSSGLTIDWVKHQAAFIRRPIVTRKTPYQLQSAGGALSVSGWSPNDKKMVGATIVTPTAPGTHPTGVISVPNWNQIKLNDAIFPGCPYTWADATRNGERVPEGKEVIQGIIQVAQLITQLTQKTTGTTKWQINSWYRDPATNSRVSSSGRAGPHTTGSAVDFWFPGQGLINLYKQLDRDHQGGVAIHPAVYEGAGFVHIDMIGATLPGSPRRRWSY